MNLDYELGEISSDGESGFGVCFSRRINSVYMCTPTTYVSELMCKQLSGIKEVIETEKN